MGVAHGLDAKVVEAPKLEPVISALVKKAQACVAALCNLL